MGRAHISLATLYSKNTIQFLFPSLPDRRTATSDTLRHRVNAMPAAKNTQAQAHCTLCSAKVWKSFIVAHTLGRSSPLAILPISWSCSLCRSVMVVGMSSRRSNILTPATKFLAADMLRLRNASSRNHRSIAFASGKSVAHPRIAPRNSCMYFLDGLASTPLMAMPCALCPTPLLWRA